MTELAADPRRGRARISSVRFAVRLVRSSAPRLTMVLAVMSIVQAVAIGAELAIGGRIVDLAVEESTTTDDVVPWLVVLGVLLSLSLFAGAVIQELRLIVRELLHRATVNEMLKTAMNAELEAFEQPAFHNRLARARVELGDYAWAIVWGAVSFFSGLFTMLAVAIVLMRVVPLLVPIAMIGAIPVAVVGILNNRIWRAHYTSMTELSRDREYHQELLTTRDPAKDIIAFGLAPHLYRHHEQLFSERIVRTRRAAIRRLVRSTIGSVVSAMVLVGTLAAAVILAINGHITVGGVAIAVVGLNRLNQQIRSVSASVGTLHEAALFIGDLEDFAAMVPPVESDLPVAPPSPSHISVRELTYRYPGSGRNALQGVNLEVRRGQVLAVVGPNGGGKTTLVKILGGLLPATSGTVLWDGVDVGSCDPDSVRREVASVFQDVTRFQISARDNVLLGDIDHPDEARLLEAAEAAGLRPMVQDLPNGWDTRLGKTFSESEDLSIGQWQRIAIARAFYRAADVVIMDEPSASLDPMVEAELFDSLRRLGDNRITIFVSHRFSNVRSADSIVVVSDGRVAEQGTHDELMAINGFYADMFSLQGGAFTEG